MSTNLDIGGFDTDVEVGGDFANEEAKAPEKAPKQAVEAAVEQEEAPLELTEDEEIIEEEEAPEEAPRPAKGAKERIKDLVKEKRELQRELERERIKNELRAELKLPGDEINLRAGATSGNNVPRVAPDPSDLQKYPLGALDDRYVEDKIAFGIESALGSVLQRQQENAQKAEAERVATENLKKAEAVVQKGSELYDDFDEVVWEAGKRGEYPMSEPTFLAITEAEHGAEIAYALASDKAEAARVAGLSPYQQLKYVSDKNAEFAARTKPRLPKAGTPPAHQSRGTSGKFSVAPDTDDLEAFSRELFQR